MPQFLSYRVGEKAAEGQGLTGEFVAVLQLAEPVFPLPERLAKEGFRTHTVANEALLQELETQALTEGSADDIPIIRGALKDVRSLKARAAQFTIA